MYTVKISIRSLLYRRKQYISLFLVCAFGVAVSLSSIFISKGMIQTMSKKASVYFGGDYVFMGADKKNGILYINTNETFEKLKSVLPPQAVLSPRMDYDARHSAYYFEGTEALQKTIKGVDFNLEKNLFNNLTFVEGGIDEMTGSNGVLISLPVARILNVHVGDSMTFRFECALENVIDTAEVVVKGIFQDSSAFGMYTSYMDFNFLKKIHGRSDWKDVCNRVCINFPEGQASARQAAQLFNSLKKIFNMFGPVEEKDSYYSSEKTFENATYAIIPLSANLTDVKILQLAMDAVVSFVILMLTVIIIAGIGSTYRILVMKRINEIGIYMAIGMKKKSILFTLLFESLVLLVLGCFAGLLLSGIICAAISVPDISFIPSFEMFLVNGNLSPSFDVLKCIMVTAAVILVTIAAVLYSVWKSVKVLPVQALAETE